MANVDYSKAVTPPEYKCGNCGSTGVKLWRALPKLLCARCAARDQRKNIDDIDANGLHSEGLGQTDQIGFYVPAVPTERGNGYWGYTSVPEAGIHWWQSLPSLTQTA